MELEYDQAQSRKEIGRKCVMHSSFDFTARQCATPKASRYIWIKKEICLQAVGKTGIGCEPPAKCDQVLVLVLQCGLRIRLRIPAGLLFFIKTLPS